MKIITLFFALILIMTSQAQAARLCSQIFRERGRSEFPLGAQLNIYSFFSSQNTNQARVGSYVIRDGYFSPSASGVVTVTRNGQPVGNERSPRRTFSEENTTLLNHLQSFTTKSMVDRGQLTNGERASKEEIVGVIDPHQVVFIEATTPVETSTVRNRPAEYPREIISSVPIYGTGQTTSIRQAGAWIIGGQFLFSGNRTEFRNNPDVRYADQIFWETNRLQIVDARNPVLPDYQIDIGYKAMPWQFNKELIGSGQMPLVPGEGIVGIDRGRFPIVFEVGRLAQNTPQYAESIYRAAIHHMALEATTTLAGRIEDVYIFSKTFDAANTRRLQRMGFEQLENSCIGGGCVLHIPLNRLIERFGIGDLSLAQHRIGELNPRFQPQDRSTMLSWARTFLRAELDFIIPQAGITASRPIVVNNLSHHALSALTYMFQFGGLRNIDAAYEAARELFQWAKEYYPNEGHFDVADHVSLKSQIPFLQDNNAVRITNLDKAEAISNPLYVPGLLMGLDGHLLRKLEEVGLRSEDALGFMERSGINYIIQTKEIDLAQHLWSMGIFSEPSIQRNETGDNVYTFLISRQQVAQIREDNPLWSDYFRTHGVDQGFWFFRSISADPHKI